MEPVWIDRCYTQICVLWTPWDQQKVSWLSGVLIIQVSLYEKASFVTITMCVDYASQVSWLTGFTTLTW